MWAGTSGLLRPAIVAAARRPTKPHMAIHPAASFGRRMELVSAISGTAVWCRCAALRCGPLVAVEYLASLIPVVFSCGDCASVFHCHEALRRMRPEQDYSSLMV